MTRRGGACQERMTVFSIVGAAWGVLLGGELLGAHGLLPMAALALSGALVGAGAGLLHRRRNAE